MNIDVYSYANGKGETESVTSHVWKKKWTKHVLNVTSSNIDNDSISSITSALECCIANSDPLNHSDFIWN